MKNNLSNEESLNKFDEFQLEEYKNISTSHYESLKQISTFFRYYLLILAAPVFIFNIISDDLNDLIEFLKGNPEKDFEALYNFVFYYFLIISLSGFFLYLHIINIWHDSVLYARTVNKVRKYFYHNSKLDVKEYDNFKNLPIISSLPKYANKTNFLPLILLFSVINCGFIYCAFHIRSKHSEYIFNWSLFGDIQLNDFNNLIFSLLLFLIHIIGWHVMSRRRENLYLKNFAFGVDIDGVLNNQTDHFIKYFKLINGHELDKESIKEIPVHLNEDLFIDDIQERAVFNCREYWEELQENENAFKTLNKIQKLFGYRIYLFSWRDWPQYGKDEIIIKNKITRAGMTPLNEGEIDKITEKWFENLGLNIYVIKDWKSYLLEKFRLKIRIRLTLEKGNPYISDNRFTFSLKKQTMLLNRFQGSSSKKIKFFVEDSPENALKLSNICEYVFLMNQPYNKNDTFPKNVITVNNWTELFKYFRYFS